MRRIMQFSYTMFLALIVTVLSVQTLSAQSNNTERLEVTKNMYNRALNSDVDGLVESAIYNVLVMKSHHPRLDYSKIVLSLDNLSLQGRTIQIQYKAQLAGLFLKNSEIFADIRLKSTENPAPYFQTLSDRLEKVALSINSL